jgi:flagellar protein FlaG
MNVDTISSTGGFLTPQMKSSELVDSGRKQKDAADSDSQSLVDSQKVQPEELLDNIKAITQDGLYSVRFEMDQKSSDLVVKIFDNQSQEVVKQIPPEELLKFKASFNDLVGNIVNTEG